MDSMLVNMTLGNGETIPLMLVDTAGQERFQSLAQNFLRNSHGVILVYDLTNIESLRKLKQMWIQTYITNANKAILTHTLLIGNKLDLLTAISDDTDITTKIEIEKNMIEEAKLLQEIGSFLTAQGFQFSFKKLSAKTDKKLLFNEILVELFRQLLMSSPVDRDVNAFEKAALS